MLKENNCQPRILYSAKIPFGNEGEIKTFSNEEKLIEFVTSSPILKEWVKEFSKQKWNCKKWNFGTSEKKKEQYKQK